MLKLSESGCEDGKSVVVWMVKFSEPVCEDGKVW